jgi:hypothetical protein
MLRALPKYNVTCVRSVHENECRVDSRRPTSPPDLNEQLED